MPWYFLMIESTSKKIDNVKCPNRVLFTILAGNGKICWHLKDNMYFIYTI